jgi:glycosyltransferase involved in cell wall biosynthesis
MNDAVLTKRPDCARCRLSVVVPAFNEGDGLPEFQRRLGRVLESIPGDHEIIYVNDGSTDETFAVMKQLASGDERIAVVDLSRNFGKEIAMTAGLDLAAGEAVIVIDADLQDPPELIPALVEAWKEGYDVVYAKRLSRRGDTIIKRMTSYAFYRLIRRVSHVDIPRDTGDFRLLSRRAVAALMKLREHHRFMKGLFAWIGYPQKAIGYQRAPRFAGSTKFDYWKLWNFALDGITSFTIAPLKIATFVGLSVAALALVYAAWIVYKTIVFGEPVRGYPTLIVVTLLLGGVQLACLGLLGEYVGRMFDEVKARPLYLINRYAPSRNRSALDRSASPAMRGEPAPGSADPLVAALPSLHAAHEL